MKYNLKPCPFCGGKGELVISISNTACWIKCDRCGATTMTVKAGLDYSAKEKAVELWNTRMEADS